MKKNYELSELRLKKQVVIGKIILVPMKERESGIQLIPKDILSIDKNKKEDGKYLDEYIDHIFQLNVILVGEGIHEFFPRGINKGDIVYLDRPPMESDMLNLNGEIYARAFVNNIIAVRTPKVDKSKLN